MFSCTPRSCLALLFLDQQQVVPVAVAEEEHQRHRPVAADQLLVHVDAVRLHVGMIGARVGRRQRDARVARRLVVALRRHERQRGPAARRRNLHPAVAVAERHVGGERETEFVAVKGDRAVLVGGRHHHPADLCDLRHVSPFSDRCVRARAAG
jgi:hypothetical protein